MQGRGGATLALANAIVRASALGLIAALASLLAVRGSLLVIAAPLGAAIDGPLVARVGAQDTLLISALVTVALGSAAVVLGRERSISPAPEPGFRVSSA